jgi:hypothetical protein
LEAESKRSWFTIRDSLRAAAKGGRLWTPVVVTLGNQTIRVSTSKEAVEFRPRKLRWIAADTFVVTGLGLRKGPSFQRSYLRFRTPEEAAKAATIIKRNPSVLEEPLVPVEEFPVQLRLLLTGRYVIFLLYAVFVNILVGSFLFLILSAFGMFGTVAGAVALMGYASFPLWAAFVRMRRRTKGWLRIQGRSIVVRSLDWTPIFPKVIEWKSSRIIVLGGRGVKYELSFPTDQDLTQVIARIRTAYPQVQEILAETYK